MAVMGVLSFTLCTGHTVAWMKQTNKQKKTRTKTMKQNQVDFPGTENKEVFRFTSSVSSIHQFGIH